MFRRKKNLYIGTNSTYKILLKAQISLNRGTRVSLEKMQEQTDVRLKLSPPELWHLSFTRNELTEEFTSEPPSIIFGLGLNRISATSLGVELTVELTDFKPLSLRVTYRAVFEIADGETPDEIDLQLRLVAAQIAPAVLYPFIRETVLTTALKAGLPPVLPPIVNFRSVFDPAQVTLPELAAAG